MRNVKDKRVFTYRQSAAINIAEHMFFARFPDILTERGNTQKSARDRVVRIAFRRAVFC